MKRLAEDRSTVIKPADKNFCVGFWDRIDYLIEAKKDLSDSNTYKEVKFDDNGFVKLAEVSNTLMKRLLLKECISPEATNLEKFTKYCMMYWVSLPFLFKPRPWKNVRMFGLPSEIHNAFSKVLRKTHQEFFEKT